MKREEDIDHFHYLTDKSKNQFSDVPKKLSDEIINSGERTANGRLLPHSSLIHEKFEHR